MAKFCTNCGNALEAEAKFCPSCGIKISTTDSDANIATQENPVMQKSQPPIQHQYPPQYAKNKNRTTAAILAFFLGGFGAHKFYLGDNTQGLIRLLLCWTMIPGFIGLYDFIKLLTMSETEFDSIYNNPNMR